MIFRCFSKAYERLQATLSRGPSLHSEPRSVLATILGTDFEQYEQQRDVLYQLHHGTKRQRRSAKEITQRNTAHRLTRTDHLSTSNQIVHGPNTAKGSLTSSVDKGSSISDDHDDGDGDAAVLPSNSTQKSTENQPAYRRAERFKKLRPDVAHQIGERLMKKRAVQLGGYLDAEAMSRDLAERENQQKEKKKHDLLSEHKKQQEEAAR